MTTIVSVVGARPQFIKAGPMSKALRAAGVNEVLLHTGQHYDPVMSAEIMRDVGLRRPDLNLDVGSASHGVQTGRIIEGVEAYLTQHQADAVLTYGDTNSTIASALAAVKLGVFTGHVEAGLRSFNRLMPEEINRVVTDRVSDVLFAPTETAYGHLTREGLADRSVRTGDVMVDALNSVDFDKVATPVWARGHFLVATIHRAENTDDRPRLMAIIQALNRLDLPVHLIAHPRLAARIQGHDLASKAGSLVLHPPLGYAEMLGTIRAGDGLITDSGGLQKEAYILRVPCITIRGETEWPETLAGSWNVLVEPNDNLIDILNRRPVPTDDNPFGDGKAAPRIVAELLARL